MRLKRLLISLLVAASATSVRSETAPLPWQPYLHVNQGIDLPSHLLRSVAGDTPARPLIAQGRSQVPGQPPLVVWAFASGECGQEQWGEGMDADLLVAANAPLFAAAGLRYRISTGGEVGVFTCSSEAGMTRFLERYRSPALDGFDFDIEGRQTPEQIDTLVREAAAAARRHPGLHFGFTLATLAASDGSHGGLNATGEHVMAALKRHRFDTAVINLMVMNYGPGHARNCVLQADGQTCDMGRSGLQAALNLQQRHGVPLARIALTAMLGRNDVAENRFSLADAQQMQRDATARGLARLYYWSLDRDAPCPGGATTLSPRCHSLADVPAGAFGATR